MNNSSKGFVGIILILLVVIVVGAGMFYYSKHKPTTATVISNNTEPISAAPVPITNALSVAGYKTYSNSKLNYSVDVPEAWNIQDHGDIFIFPITQKGTKDLSVDEIYTDNTKGITITTLGSGVVTEKLKTNFALLTKNIKPANFAKVSDAIQEIKMEAMIEAEVDELAYGYKGSQYMIRTNNRIYAVNVIYRKDEDKAEQDKNIAQLVLSLKENQ